MKLTDWIVAGLAHRSRWNAHYERRTLQRKWEREARGRVPLFNR